MTDLLPNPLETALGGEGMDADPTPVFSPPTPEWVPAGDQLSHHWRDMNSTVPASVNIYQSREVQALEIERVWKRTWQMACFASDIRNPGDTRVYDVGPLSLIIVRTRTGDIKAFYNSCLHRGTRIANSDGNNRALTCPYHSWSWNLDGSMSRMPGEWDFPHLDKSKLCLPEAKAEVWSGMVWINFDPNAMPLLDYLTPLPEHYQRYWPGERRAPVAHIRKVMKSNWKATIQAFMESYHVMFVHPQLKTRIQFDDPLRSCFQYDAWEHTSRLAMLIDEKDGFIDGGGEYRKRDRGTTATALKVSPDQLSKEENDSHTVNYHVFPNIQLGATKLKYISRTYPYGDDPTMSILDLLVIKHFPEGEELPPPPVTKFLGPEDPMSDAPEIILGNLGPEVYQQDVDVLPLQQRGMAAAAPGHEHMNFSVYQETCVRHHDFTARKFLAQP